MSRQLCSNIDYSYEELLYTLCSCSGAFRTCTFHRACPADNLALRKMLGHTLPAHPLALLLSSLSPNGSRRSNRHSTGASWILEAFGAMALGGLVRACAVRSSVDPRVGLAAFHHAYFRSDQLRQTTPCG